MKRFFYGLVIGVLAGGCATVPPASDGTTPPIAQQTPNNNMPVDPAYPGQGVNIGIGLGSWGGRGIGGIGVGYGW